MSVALILLLLALVAGFYVAWNIGANDVANAVGTSVGSGALTLKQAVVIAALFEFAGAFFFGGDVAETIESGIVNPSFFPYQSIDFVYGMISSLLAAGVWLQMASFFGWPVSTTHSIVGAVLGFGLVAGGVEAIQWGHILSIIVSWVVSPLLGGLLSYLLFSFIRSKILYRRDPVVAAKKYVPYFVFIIFFVSSLIILFGGIAEFSLYLDARALLAISFGISILCGLIAKGLTRKIESPRVSRQHNLDVEIGLKKAEKHLRRVEAASLGEMQDRVRLLSEEVGLLAQEVEVPEVNTEYVLVERMFAFLQIVVACFMAFAHGSNDVANAIGPLSAILNALYGRLWQGPTVSLWLLLLGGTGIVIGLATWGWRVIETVGRRITELTPSRGFAAGLSSALTIILASKLGLPISTTHVLVGAVLGVGIARGIGAINLGVIRDIVVAWLVTVPVGALFSIGFFTLLRLLFGHA